MRDVCSGMVLFVLACLSSACAVPQGSLTDTVSSFPLSAKARSAWRQSPDQLPGNLAGNRFHHEPVHTRRDVSEQALRRSRLISFDFVQTMIQLEALHPRRVRVAISPSESRFDEMLVYSLTLAGYAMRAGEEESLPPVELLSDDGLPQVIDPFSGSRTLASSPSGFSSRAGSTEPFAPSTMSLTTRIVAEPPLLPDGASKAGIYSFFVSAHIPTLSTIRLSRIYRVKGAGVVPVSKMRVEGTEAHHLRADDTMF